MTFASIYPNSLARPYKTPSKIKAFIYLSIQTSLVQIRCVEKENLKEEALKCSEVCSRSPFIYGSPATFVFVSKTLNPTLLQGRLVLNS